MSTLRNVAKQALNPRRFAVMTYKVVERVMGLRDDQSRDSNLAWITANLSDFSNLAKGWDSALWAESLARSREIEDLAKQTLQHMPYDLGGGGAYPLLHFLTRYMRPERVLETGVAAGFSSYAFLDALHGNGCGTLYSSDFPYFRLPNPEQYIGVVVPSALKRDWHLYIEGDGTNLRRILSDSKGQIDLFHYDSDKSYKGRRWAMEFISPRLADDAVVLMDDIQDNSFFRDYVMTLPAGKSWWVFKFQGKYVGMVGEPVPGEGV